MKTIEIIPWHATSESECPVDGDTMVTVWDRHGRSRRDRACELWWHAIGDASIIAYAVTPDEVFKPGRFRARIGEVYYYVTNTGGVYSSKELDDGTDLQRNMFGNYFETEEQTAEASRRLQATLNAYHEELMRGEG